jgi:hypothetical protein
MSATVALGERHYLAHRRPPVRDLLQALVDEPFQPRFFIAVNVTPERALTHA